METNEKELIAKRVRYARERKGITQEDVGTKFGVTNATVCRWEKGNIKSMKTDVIKEMARWFDVNVLWLLGDNVPMERPTEAKLELESDIRENLMWLDEEQLKLVKTIVDQMKGSKK